MEFSLCLLCLCVNLFVRVGSHLAGQGRARGAAPPRIRSDTMSGLEGLLAGRTLAGRYRIEEVIGRGGFAAVYRARDERLGRTTAVKVITLAASDPEVREQIQRRFEREARVAASLDHPNVVTVYDVGTDTDLQMDFLVMELLHGEDLAHRLARPEPLPVPAAVRILRDAARGIGAGHAGGLIHRDVKPANIFLAEHEREHRFRVCVLDFGIAQILHAEHSLTRLTSGAAPLSPRYASPEQLQESKDLTPASDVYSLGLIGCELLTWERPFSPVQVRAMSRGERPDAPPLTGASPELRATLHRALEWEPEHRFPDARQMAEALDEVLNSLRDTAPPIVTEPVAPEPVVAPVPVVAPEADARPAGLEPAVVEHAAQRPEPARREAPRRRVSPALAGIPVLLVAGGAAWWALSGDKPAERTAAAPAPVPVETAPVQPPPKPAPRAPDSLTWHSSLDEEAGTVPEPTPTEDAAPATGAGASAPRVAQAPPERTPASTPEPKPAASEPAPAASGRSAAAYAREADRLFTRGSYPAAVAGFRRAVAAAPRNAYYRNQLGWALFQTGDMAGAERELREAVRLDPDRAIAYANLGEVYRVRGDTPRAVTNYRRFLELNREPRRERIATEKLRSMGATP